MTRVFHEKSWSQIDYNQKILENTLKNFLANDNLKVFHRPVVNAFALDFIGMNSNSLQNYCN